MEKPWQNWIWLLGFLFGGVLAASLHWRSLEPLTGASLYGCAVWISLCGLLFGISFHLTSKRGWRFLPVILFPRAFLIACPAASKAGVRLRFSNESAATCNIRIARVNEPRRAIVLKLYAAQTLEYRTAAGDYAESLQFVLSFLEHGLQANVSELRTNRIVLSNTGLRLEPVTDNIP